MPFFDQTTKVRGATSAIGNSGVDLAISMSVMGKERIEELGVLGSRN